MADDEQATVLVVDDEDSVRDTYELYLREEYDVRTAENGGEALVELSGDVDVVLLDRRMPGMSGDEVLDHIRRWDDDCRVAVITAVDPDTDIVSMDFDDYLTKPIDRDELVETVEQLLLFETYEDLLSEYHSVTRTYATLESHAEETMIDVEDELERLRERRADLRAELAETVDSFTDDHIADVFRKSHGALK